MLEWVNVLKIPDQVSFKILDLEIDQDLDLDLASLAKNWIQTKSQVHQNNESDIKNNVKKDLRFKCRVISLQLVRSHDVLTKL